MTLFLFWYIGFYLNIISIAKEDGEIVRGQVIAAGLLPYIAFIVLNFPDLSKSVWKSKQSKGDQP